jgi:predicted esterase
LQPLKTVCLIALSLFTIQTSPLAAEIVPGWSKVAIPSTGSYYWRYVPTTVDTTKPLPLILFLHGAGSKPESYRTLVAPSAEEVGVIVAMPKSSSDIGWGVGPDRQTVAETSRMVREELAIDELRVSIAGHSAGGAYGYQLAYAGSDYNAVFSLAAPFYPVSAVADATYKPPIRMYYGTTDPNFVRGSAASLEAQWGRLGVAWEEDVQEGFGHNSWPASSMTAGFQFLISRSRPAAAPACAPSDTQLCLNHGRFRVEVTWDANGASGPGKVVPGASADSGLFWFFNADNWEIMVKVLDACAYNGRYWVYAAGTTNLHYVLKVTDTATGAEARYENPAGHAAAAVTDSNAFQTCP